MCYTYLAIWVMKCFGPREKTVSVSVTQSYLKFSIPLQRDKILLVQSIRIGIETDSS